MLQILPPCGINMVIKNYKWYFWTSTVIKSNGNIKELEHRGVYSSVILLYGRGRLFIMEGNEGREWKGEGEGGWKEKGKGNSIKEKGKGRKGP